MPSRRQQRRSNTVVRPAQVVIGYCDRGDVEANFTASLVGSFLYDRRFHEERGFYRIVGTNEVQGSRIANQRNQCVAHFLTDEAYHRDGHPPAWLMMVDADMSWEMDAIHRLVERAEQEDLKVLSGLCFAGGRTACWPTLYATTRDDDGELVTAPYPELPDTELVKVGATGAAFLLVHRDVFVTIGRRAPDNPEPWFADGVSQGRSFGEDVTFCLRAQAVGFDVYVDLTVEIGHVKRFTMDREFWNGSHPR